MRWQFLLATRVTLRNRSQYPFCQRLKSSWFIDLAEGSFLPLPSVAIITPDLMHIQNNGQKLAPVKIIPQNLFTFCL